MILAIGILLFFIPALSHSAAKKTDLRILIDVSGSMKVNDPHNLRTPSVRLLIGLIPEGTKAGIWTFGKYVNMQVKYGVVNKQWKTRARSAVEKIHSRGLYTNIEAVLKKSSFDWKTKDPKTNRHIILLTDGVVDISTDPEINLKSRNTIIKKYLPKLKKAGVKIHTIALSNQADHELLKLLSVSTDGWYELIEDPKKLHRVFLRLFEKSTTANALPLKNNLFKVDKSINDMTVLSFNTNDTLTKLITPSKKIFTEKDNPESVSWFHEDGYDLITITKPEAGDWKLDAPVDKDNRVLVVTNLTLFMNDIPNNVLLNQRILLKAELKQKDKKIKNKNFLKLVKVEAIKKSLNSPDSTIKFLDDGKKLDEHAGDGIYYSEIRSPLRAGVFELVIRAQGPTFQRQRQYLVNVFNGLATIEIQDNKDKNPFFIEILPHKGLLQEGSVDINYQVNNGKSIKLVRDSHELWKIELPAEDAGKKISFTISGIRQNNKSVEMQMERVLPARIKKIEKKEVDVKPKKKTEPGKLDKNKKDHEEGAWLSVLIWVLVINLILVIIGVGVYFVLKKIRAKNADKDKEELQL
ncbi:MAG: VWA domain-containing protein [Gammaproteobacteria bacterium]